MRKMERRILAWLLLLLLVCSSAPLRAEAAAGETAAPASAGATPETRLPEERKKVTVMIYMTGSDLEPSSKAATKDMEEMAASGIDLRENNLVVFTGGAPKWHCEVPEDVNALLQLTEDGFQLIDSFPQLSMGTAENLSRFLNLAWERFPAEEYYLILWDHGNGPVMGYCMDKLYNNDMLSLAEMRQALEDSPFSAENRLGILGFDACLMASAELVCMLGDYADYMIASQETEPNFGWNYAFLGDCGKIPAKDLACRAADAYLAYSLAYFDNNPFFNSDVTLAVVDLAFASELKDGICALFRRAAPDVLGRFNRIAASRVQTRSFGRATTGSEYDLVDLRCLLEEMGEEYPDETAELTALLDRMVVCSASNTEQSCGLSLYFPFYNKNYYSSQWKEAYRDMDVFPDYLSFLYRYEQTWLGADLQELYDTALLVEKREPAGTYFLPLTPEQLDAAAEARFYILRRLGEGVYAPVYIGTRVEKGPDGLTAFFDGNIIYYEDDFGAKGIPSLMVTNQVGSRTDYRLTSCFVENVPIGYSDWEQRKCDLQLSADASDGSVAIKGIYEMNPDEGAGTGKQAEIDLSQWRFMFFVDLPARYLTRAENGRILGLWQWPTRDSLEGWEIPLADNVHFVMEPLYDDGRSYYLMFELTDVQGDRLCSEPCELEVQPAPPAPEPEYTLVEWREDLGGELELQGVRLRFDYGKSAESQRLIFSVTASNETDSRVAVHLDRPSVNGISGDSFGMGLELEPGQTLSREFWSLEALLSATGSASQIRFFVSVEDSDNYATFCRDLPVELANLDEREPAILHRPFMDAFAEQQLLLSEDGMEVTLLGLGFYPGSWGVDENASEAQLMAFYRIDNRSDAGHSVSVPALCLNGVELNASALPFWDVMDLEPGQSCYCVQKLSRKALMRPDPADDDPKHETEQLLIDSISSASALLVVDERGVWLPIRLDRAGTGKTLTPGGELLYEDETWRVYREACEERGTEKICLWIENKTDQVLSFTLRGGEQYLASDIIGPRARCFLDVDAPSAEAPYQDLVLRCYTWEEAVQYYRTYLQSGEPKETEPFPLEAKGGTGA